MRVKCFFGPRAMAAFFLFLKLARNPTQPCDANLEPETPERITANLNLTQVQAYQKKFKLFSRGASPHQTPPSSRLLSQPPQARFGLLSQVGRCRGLQGGG